MRYRIIGDVIFHNDEELDIDRLVNEGILVPVTEELLTRAEWEATIDYEAATHELVTFGPTNRGDDEVARMVVDAAVGEETT